MGYYDLDPKQTGLLFFDMVNVYYKTEGAVGDSHNRTVIANAVRLKATARATGIPVCYAVPAHRQDQKTSVPLITDTDTNFRPWANPDRDRSLPAIVGGTWETQVIQELQPDLDDYLIPKYRWSAFYQTYLDLAFRSRGIDSLILCGGSTDGGVASTAFFARDMGYHLVFVEDACGCPRRDGHDFFMKRVFPRMGRVRSTDQVIQMLGEG